MNLHVKNISHEFDYPLFENVNFTLKPKQSMSVVGVSGCGKSTLLHICSTLLKPNSGEVFYNDKSLYKHSDLLKIRRNDFGIIFQSHYLFKGFSAKENLELATILSDTNLDNELYEKFGIANVLEQNIGELSGGQQQRISIARILSKKPKIIFADEPTGNLDGKTAKEVMDVLFEYIEKNDASLMLVTHDLDLARRCEFAYEIKSKKFKPL